MKEALKVGTSSKLERVEHVVQMDLDCAHGDGHSARDVVIVEFELGQCGDLQFSRRQHGSQIGFDLLTLAQAFQ